MHAGLRDETTARVSSSAVVFAPHQDDETLGCGGTMILKCQAGTQLWCVFMTDGATSHQAFMDPAKLRQLRKSEALDAAEVIGLPPDRLDFLDFPDGNLAAYRNGAVESVAAILSSRRPEEVYVPYARDGTPDHEATYRIVIDAVTRIGRRTTVLEYPVWFWNHWPWVPLKLEMNRSAITVLRRVVDAEFGRELLREFRTGVFVASVIEQKKQALARHRSQVSALIPDVSWPTLQGVSDGEFLDCLFQDFEVFRSSIVPGHPR